VLPGHTAGAEQRLPVAGVDPLSAQAAPPGVGERLSSAVGTDAIPGRTLILWAVLIAGVLALAAIAWSVLRQSAKGKP
jgi:hypothetical protein